MLDGAAEAVADLRERGDDVVFVTNSSYFPVDAVEDKLAAVGIPAEGDAITSAIATASMVSPGQTVLVSGGPGLHAAFGERGANVVESASPTPDAVAIGIDPTFDYERLAVVADAARDGARLLATNRDSTYPTPSGLRPGCGSIVVAVEAASGARAEFGGKPEAPTMDLVAERLGSEGWVAGDRPDTDGLLAQRLGYGFALISSGVNDGVGAHDGLLDAVRAHRGRKTQK